MRISRPFLRRVGPTSTVFLVSLAVSLLQAPGRLVADTKLDLVVDPNRLISRGLQAWDAISSTGQVGNQIFGYAFPVGPFFSLCRGLAISPWIAQRLWWAVLLTLAVTGVARACQLLAVGSRTSRLVAGLAYAYSPTVLILMGRNSAAALGLILAPWVVVPLARAANDGTVWKGALLSGIPVAAMGGANAAVVVGALVLPTLFILTRRGWRWKAHMLAAFGAVTFVVSLRWLLPLVSTARFATDFTLVTERSSAILPTQSMLESLRGTGNWVAWWPVRLVHASSAIVLVGSVVTAGVGLAGLWSRRSPERSFARWGVLLGMFTIAAGYPGPGGGPLARSIASFIDGPGRALRNVYKFEPTLRFALSLGIAGLFARRTAHTVADGRSRRHAVGLVAAATAVVLMAAPVLAGHLGTEGSFETLPTWWRDLADEMQRHQTGRTLLLPGSEFGTFVWGVTNDEPLQALTDQPWAARDVVVLAGSDTMRLLDEIDEVVVRPAQHDALLPLLRRAGISRVVLRLDIDASKWRTAPSVYASSLQRAGLWHAGSFGPSVTSLRPDIGRTSPDASLRALEVFDVPEPDAQVTSTPMRDVIAVTGGPEEVASFTAVNALAHRPALSPSDSPQNAPTVLTDGDRRRAVSVGRVRNQYSATLAADAARKVGDPLEPVAAGTQSVLAFRGASVTASAAGDPLSTLRGSGPVAAFDGDVGTEWTAGGANRGLGQWIEVHSPTPLPPGELRIRSAASPTRPAPTTFEISTNGGGYRRADVRDGVASVRLDEWSALRIRIARVGSGDRLLNAGIAEVSYPGLAVVPVVKLPSSPPGRRVAAIVLRRSRGAQGTFEPDEDRAMRRRLDVPPSTFRWRATVAPHGRGWPLRHIPESGVAVDATSNLFDLSDTAAWHAADGDPYTSWVAEPADPEPTLTMSWVGRRRIRRLAVSPSGGRTKTPTTAEIEGSDGAARTVEFDDGGVATFAPLDTDFIRLRVTGMRTVGQATTKLPPSLSISELKLEVSPALPRATGVARGKAQTECGSGPDVVVAGAKYHSRIVASAGWTDPLVVAEGCTEISMPGGSVDLDAVPTIDRHTVESLEFLASYVGDTSAGSRVVTVDRWDPSRRTVRIGPGEATLITTHEAFNDIWQVTTDGMAVAPVKVDGWQQGFIVPAGPGGTIDLNANGAAALSVGVFGGLALVVLVGVAGLAMRRRHRARVGPAQQRPTWAWIASFAFALAAAPWIAAAVVVAVAILRRGRGHRWGTFGVALAGIAALVVALADALAHFASANAVIPVGTFGSVAQLCTAFAVVTATMPAIGQTDDGNGDQHSGQDLDDRMEAAESFERADTGSIRRPRRQADHNHAASDAEDRQSSPIAGEQSEPDCDCAERRHDDGDSEPDEGDERVGLDR